MWEICVNVFHTPQHNLHLELEEKRVEPGGELDFGGSMFLIYPKSRHSGEFIRNLYLR